MQVVSKLKKDILWALVLLLPYILWLWIYHDIFTGRDRVLSDNWAYFHAMKYHFQSLMHGVFPLWMPYQSWGTIENFEFRAIGDFNPFFLLIPLFIGLGASPYLAFVLVMALYFWMGCLGFYALAYQVTKERHLSLLAYLMWMFSSLGVLVWEQLAVLCLIVPTIWFFVFFIGFLRSKSESQLRWASGVIFTIMLVLTTYLPFFFLTVFFCFLAASLLCSPLSIWQTLLTIGGFIRRSPGISFLLITAVILAALPWGLWFLQCHSGENVLLIDRAAEGSRDQLSVDPMMINSGCLFSQGLWSDMFSNYSALINFRMYVPLLAFILLGLSFFNRLRRSQLILFFTTLFLFIVASANLTPIYKLLYAHIPMLRMFRNYFFFWQFIHALFILYVIGELKELMSWIPTAKNKIIIIAYVLAVHAILTLYLLKLDDVPSSSYLTIILSALWFSLYAGNFFKTRDKLFIPGLIIIMLVGALQVQGYYKTMFEGHVDVDPSMTTPPFAYVRPQKGNGINETHAFYDRVKSYQDESGFVKRGYVGLKDSYRLYSSLPEAAFKDYVRYKLVVYDNTALCDFKDADLGKLSYYLGNFINQALVDDPRGVGVTGGGLKARALTEQSDELKVSGFTLNTIDMDTNFAKKEFLVYNDSYHQAWHAAIDGKTMPIFRSNMAFKGLWVEGGRHHISLSFNPEEHLFFWCLLLLFSGWFAGLLYFWSMRWLNS